MESSQLVKVFGLLEATADRPEGRTLADLAAEVSLAKPTAHRLLKTLVALGYMERCGNGIYRQTPAIKRIVTGDDDRRLVQVAEPFLKQLHEQTQETVNLGVLRVGRVVYLHVLESPHPLRRIVNPNMTDPFACTALGRAIVAHLPADRQQFLLNTTPIERRTPHTVVEMDALKQILVQTKELGYAVEENQTDLGVMCIGVPVFDGTEPMAAISISLPTLRATPERIPELLASLQATAKELGEKVRFRYAESPPLEV
ncbi:IclR family transcriptional regulator [Tuwongella immobilis]|uniref:HTH iclR-type domain-containing protein n=1 Tax=Tuwongella immobilis TaxID=692036 RepID=A0A6C2YLG0_9BACT|nr:IclR family transcriptional regulator [Tuwongella immobilis]VIP02410.1 family transcriptional regulator : IclR family transcriptional regulator OS=Phycisphaera mikurensis (strain NBRC 102666 / KCTC 22515 / FYK2301M01) GN=PSMK_09000 PE=4 SV=1: HTH_IclR: IclR [Tuwongella immobilis]VTS01315.1 family transcriptional regulator : IclR family transcriptional regulator OS=Phycisphaera mikurensis (strain NBRC 102666 / KCTC 22515 / FYK2301M01) GN=PSMK_09000 PE=4 SV=1: HTH_IclR: IclR [Tuwongella immobili